MAMYVTGVAGVAVFYLLVLGVGAWAAAAKRRNSQRCQDDLILANRGLGLCLGIFTMIATWVGGAFINGTAEAMYTRGLAWCQVPIGYSLSLLFGAVLFVKQMRRAEYVTMLDPFQRLYGARVGALLFLPALLGDLFWCGAVLRALGGSLSIVAGIDQNISICASALLAATYTVFGGWYSVALTDALLLGCIAIGLSVVTPFAVLHPAVSLEKNLSQKDWLGEIRKEDFGEWADGMLLLIFGGIPWQSYFQRILSVKSTSIARVLSITSMFGCIILAVPSALLGVVGRATDWYFVTGYNRTLAIEDGSVILPLVLRELTPQWVSFVGLSAISAAVMSSADSSILASSSMFTRNIYRQTIRPKASERELDWVLRITIIAIAILSTVVALTVRSVCYLSYLCSDMVYVVLFPQLVSIIYWPSAVDAYGCLAGYLMATVLRVAGGEKSLGIPTLIEFPFYDHESKMQKFPFRTCIMIGALLTQLLVSTFTRNVLGRGYLPKCTDVLGIYSSGIPKDRTGVIQSSSGAALLDDAVNETTAGALEAERDGTGDGELPTKRFETSSGFCDVARAVGSDTFARNANQGTRTLRSSQKSSQPPVQLQNRRVEGSHPVEDVISPRATPVPGARDLTVSFGQVSSQNSYGMNGGTVPHVSMTALTPVTATSPITATPIATPGGYPPYARLSATQKTEKMVERSNMELKLNTQEGVILKKNVKGVKLVGMEGGTLRRPSLQGTFSPTPSVELVHILDRRQSNGSYGPSSLSPVPGVEACKTHGTAVGGVVGNEHCSIKRGIVRHHSFNETGDRALTTLARQPTYPSMPLRTEDYRMTLARRDKRPNVPGRHSSAVEETIPTGFVSIVSSPTFHPSIVKNCNFLVADDEAVSRF
ncbi:high affinity choline transporter 1 [Orussus abietinus]|uniref:high affinity choline transporter 1 n=1 Tax=Orussus abietinus TaxID=222816 RepID=UPI000626B2D4|nr:high affinity choline transporter 1 [Orussus abietinus]